MNERDKLLEPSAKRSEFSLLKLFWPVIILASLGLSAASLYVSLQNKQSSNDPRHQKAAFMNIDDFAGKRILFFAGHPDDTVGSSGAFIAALTAKHPSTTVHVEVLTNGDARCSRDATVSKSQCAAQRVDEEKACNALLGVDPANVRIEQSFSDNHLWDGTYTDLAIADVIVRTIRRIRPHVVFTFFPDPIWSAVPSDGYGDMGFHPDHQKTGKMVSTVIAGFSAGSRVLYNESEFGAAWKVEQLWFWQFVNPTHCFTVTPSLREIQLEAFLQHKSQYVNSTQITEWVHDFSLLIGRNCGATEGTMSEGFQRFW